MYGHAGLIACWRVAMVQIQAETERVRGMLVLVEEEEKEVKGSNEMLSLTREVPARDAAPRA
jgi:hypothetical protein